MHRLYRFFLPVLLVSLVGACTPEQTIEPEEEIAEEVPVVTEEPALEEQEPLLEEEDLVTPNVTYTGILQEGGVTIFQQGTHRLVLNDGRMVLLESQEAGAIPLSLYAEKLVRVTGDVMPTVEDGGTIMEVKSIGWIRREPNEETGVEQEVLRTLCGGESGVQCPDGSVCMLSDEEGVCVGGEVVVVGEEEDESSEESEDGDDTEDVGDDSDEDSAEVEDSDEDEDSVPDQDEDDSEESDDADEQEEIVEEEEVIADEMVEGADEEVIPANQEEAIANMQEEDYAAERWTQEYSSQHLGFRVPVHRNWYYKSFGATASVLWHIEMGAAEVLEFGDGPLVVDLKTGSLESLGVEDGAVKQIGSKVIGYRSWTENRHFEVSATASLQEPVTFVTEGLEAIAE